MASQMPTAPRSSFAAAADQDDSALTVRTRLMRFDVPTPQDFEEVSEMGRGSFGKVMLMRDKYSKRQYAVKSEPADARLPQVEYEFRVYRDLLNIMGVPRVYQLWKHDGKRMLVMEALGPSLDKCLPSLGLTDVVGWIAPQGIRVLSRMHRKGYIHRDIKPENFLTGVSGVESKQLYIVDMGLCKKYVSRGVHIPERTDKSLTGTVRYASRYTHAGHEQSRRDDLEALGYMLIFLVNKRLPWMGIKHEDRREQSRLVGDMKESLSLGELCKDLPLCFMEYMRYVRQLGFDEAPNYALLRGYFAEAAG